MTSLEQVDCCFGSYNLFSFHYGLVGFLGDFAKVPVTFTPGTGRLFERFSYGNQPSHLPFEKLEKE